MKAGDDGMEKLRASRVAVFGLGGVGSFVAEALMRSGIGTLDLIDDDCISLTNLNRVLYATRGNVGQPKTEVVAARIASVCPDTVVHAHRCFYGADTADCFDLSQYDYIADAIDTVSAKLLLIERATATNVPVISCMGAGNKLDPTAFRALDAAGPEEGLLRPEKNRPDAQQVPRDPFRCLHPFHLHCFHRRCHLADER